MSIIGLDVASSMGWCAVDVDDFRAETSYGGTIKVSSDKNKSRCEKLGEFSDAVLLTLGQTGARFAVIEGYGFASKRIVPAVELGTMVRMALHSCAIPYIEVAPGTLKKFVLQKGNGEKSLMMKEVYKRWGYDTDSDDEADAFGLAAIGVALHSNAPPPWTTSVQRGVVADLEKKMT